MDNENEDIDIEPTEENIDEYVKKLRERLKICQKEKGEYLDGWQRAKADFINSRRDDDKKADERARYVKASILNDFLVLADSIAMAEKHKPSEESLQIYRQFAEILKKHGVSPIECVGAKFNPEFHEALMQVDVEDEDKDDTIIEEMQRGYMIENRVLRPSKVKVGAYKKVNSEQ